MKNLAKIDRFYPVFAGVLIALAVLVIITLRAIFSSLSIAGQVNEELLQASTPRINEPKLDSAIEAIRQKEITALDLGI